MTCILFKMGDGTTGIVSIGDERIYCFKYKTHWHRFSFSKRWGPYKVTLTGELIQDKDWVDDRKFVKAFDAWMALPDEEKAKWEAETTKCRADEYGWCDTAYVPSASARKLAQTQ